MFPSSSRSSFCRLFPILSLICGATLCSMCVQRTPRKESKPSDRSNSGEEPSIQGARKKSVEIEKLIARKLDGGFVYFDNGLLKDSMPPFIGIIVPIHEAKRFYVGHHDRSDGYWTPSPLAVMEVESYLNKLVSRSYPGISSRIDRYRFHFVGIVEDGQKLMFVNAFCSPPKNWERTPVMVDGGGDCYFNFKFDPMTKQISRFSVNSSR